MKKKEYKKPEMQVVNIPPCTLLTTSNMSLGGNNDEKPDLEEDLYYYGE